MNLLAVNLSLLLLSISGCNEFYKLNVTPAANVVVLSSPAITLKTPIEPIGLDTTPEFTITDIEPGATVELYSDACLTKVAETTATGTAVDLTTAVLPKGEYQVYVRQTTAEGSSACNAYANYQVSGTPMVTVWQTTAPAETITLPLKTGFRYNLLVDWGDGTPSSLITSFDDPDITHPFASSGSQTITIMGTAEAWSFNDLGDKLKLYQVTELGDLNWKSFEDAFFGCTNLTTFQGGLTDQVINMKQMFRRATAIVPDTSGWDTSAVTTMYGMFYQATMATPDTSGWDTSAVTNMSAMFTSATNANPNTSGWDTSKVTDMSAMFWNAPNAHPNTSGWDTGNVVNMLNMFRATNANPNTASWDTSKVTNMSFMFHTAVNANPDTSGWNTAAVTNMDSMFTNATNANPNTTNWNTSQVTTMNNMFRNAVNAQPNTTTWDTSKVTLMTRMFWGATIANPNTTNWNTSSLTEAYYMFSNASNANPDLSNWNFANVTNMQNMFFAASSFSITNYSNMLNRINATSALSSVILDAGPAKYNVGAAAARATLLGRGWTINDAGPE